MRTFDNYLYHNISEDNPNNEQVKQDRLNGWKECIICYNKKTLTEFGYRRGSFNNFCNQCRKEGKKIGTCGPRMIFYKNNKEIRRCSKCKEIKELKTEFPKCNGRNKTGYHDTCKKCSNILSKQSYNKYKIKIIKNKRIYQNKHKEKYLEYRRKSNKKISNTPQGKLNRRMGSGIRDVLKERKSGKHWELLVDYSVEQLKSHIESKFINGMNWTELLRGNIHIDHILPKELFEYESPNDIQFKICWSLENLQPLWKKDNNKKDDYIPDGRHARYMTPSEKLDYLRSLGYKV